MLFLRVKCSRWVDLVGFLLAGGVGHGMVWGCGCWGYVVFYGFIINAPLVLLI